jgi:hypothetical protein
MGTPIKTPHRPCWERIKGLTSGGIRSGLSVALLKNEEGEGDLVNRGAVQR